MKNKRSKNLLKALILIFVITIIVIAVKQIVPNSKAEPTTISVTYKPGNGEGTEITTKQEIYAQGTQGENDYTDNKIVLYSNGDTTTDSQVISFNGGTTDYNGYTYEKVLTGWKLTAVNQDGTKITEFVEPENQDYANPKDAAKDVNTIYAQKGWYIVPEGVTSIEVTAVYGRAIYVRSPFDTMYYDEYHIFHHGENSDGTSTLDGTAVEKSSDDNFGTSSDDAVATLKRAYELMPDSATNTVYDTVFLLCGDLYEVNYRKEGESYATGEANTYQKYTSEALGYNKNQYKPVTISSLTGEKYNLFLCAQTWNVCIYASLRIDNIKIEVLSTDNLVKVYESVSINTYPRSRQFYFYDDGMTFEVAETVISESRAQVFYGDAKYIKINSEGFDLIYTYQAENITNTKGNYIKIGGLANMNLLTTFCQNNSSENEYYLTNPPTVIITGGKVESVYGTGVAVGGSVKGNVYIWVSDGKISTIYGAGTGGVYSNETENGDVDITIYSGTIGNLYGAGQFYTANVSGNVNMNISNATITGNVYGGGKGGKVTGNVNLDINNCNIGGTVFGGGYGLTDTVKSYIIDFSALQSYVSWEEMVENYNTIAKSKDFVKWEEAPKGFPTYDKENVEIITRKYHSLSVSNATQYNLREVVIKTSLTLAEIEGNVKLSIANSTIGQDIYGGGSIALVESNVDIQISNTQIKRNVYGGGDGTRTPDGVTLYSPITGTYTPLTANGEDANEVIGTFAWTADEDILTYFTGIYDGVNKVIYNADNTTTPFDTLGEEAQAVIAKYGTQQLVYSADAEKLGKVNGSVTVNLENSTAEEVYGGGNLGKVEQNTEVNISNGSNIASIVYGGGKGADSSYTTVGGSSQVTISGTTTQVGKYGSISLGAVVGEINVIFKDYWSGNPTSKYKTMNGIDRATKVTFDNSYVILNKDSNGNLVGIKNLTVQQGSGLKISESGEISGDFTGGGDLYIDSGKCLTIGGNITGVTKVIINPIDNTMLGGIDYSYLKVVGESTATETEAVAEEAISGDKRYVILAQKKDDYTYYYISETKEITDFVEVTSTSVPDKVYNGNLENTQSVKILNNGNFTSKIALDYELFAEQTNTTKYTNIIREFVLKKDETTLATIPAGTEITMVNDGKYYIYIVGEDTTQIALADFENFQEINNIREAEGVIKNTIDATGAITYEYSEEYRFIVNLANRTTALENGTYYAMINVNDGTEWISEEQIEAANTIEITNRDYTFNYKLNKEKYESNEIINLTGTLKFSEIKDVQGQVGKDIYTSIKLLKTSTEEQININIPDGTTISINDNSTSEIVNGASQIKFLENLTNDEITENIDMKLDMSKILPQNRLDAGEYKIIIELVLAENEILESKIQGTLEIPIVIINYEENYGIKAEIDNTEQMAVDKLQLITFGEKEERTIKLQYNGKLETPKIKIKVLEKTGTFEYKETKNSNNIKVIKDSVEVTEFTPQLSEPQDITIQFGDNLSKGTYRILFELYDKYENKKSEDLINFIVE